MRLIRLFLSVISISCLTFGTAAHAEKALETEKSQAPRIKVSGVAVFDQIYHLHNEGFDYQTNGSSFRNGGFEFSTDFTKIFPSTWKLELGLHSLVSVLFS